MANFTINKGSSSSSYKVEADEYTLSDGYFVFTLRAGNQKVFSISSAQVRTITMEDPQRPGQ